MLVIETEAFEGKVGVVHVHSTGEVLWFCGSYYVSGFVLGRAASYMSCLAFLTNLFSIRL